MMNAAAELREIVINDRDAVLQALQQRDSQAYQDVRMRFVEALFMVPYDVVLSKSQTTQNHLLFQRLESLKAARGEMLNAAMVYLKPYDTENPPKRPSVETQEEIVDIQITKVGQALHEFEKLISVAGMAVGQERWPTTLAYVARGLGLKQSSDVSKLLDKGELRDNDLEGRDRRVEPISILEYCMRSGVAWGDLDRNDE